MKLTIRPREGELEVEGDDEAVFKLIGSILNSNPLALPAGPPAPDPAWSAPEPAPAPAPEEPRTHICRECDNAYWTQEGLDAHVAEAHPKKSRAKPVAKPVAKRAAKASRVASRSTGETIRPSTRRRVASLYRKGSGGQEIRATLAEAGVHVGTNTIYAVLRAEGVEIRPRGGSRAVPVKKPRTSKSARDEGGPASSRPAGRGPGDGDGGSDDPQKRADPPAPPPKKAYACDRCDRSYDSEHGLRIHRGQTGHAAAPWKPPPVVAPPDASVPPPPRPVDAGVVLEVLDHMFAGRPVALTAKKTYLSVEKVTDIFDRACRLLDAPDATTGRDLWEQAGRTGRLQAATRIAEGR